MDKLIDRLAAYHDMEISDMRFQLTKQNMIDDANFFFKKQDNMKEWDELMTYIVGKEIHGILSLSDIMDIVEKYM